MDNKDSSVLERTSVTEDNIASPTSEKTEGDSSSHSSGPINIIYGDAYFENAQKIGLGENNEFEGNVIISS